MMKKRKPGNLRKNHLRNMSLERFLFFPKQGEGNGHQKNDW